MSLGKFITGICERTGTVPVGLLCNGVAGMLMKLGETGSLSMALQQVGIGNGGTLSAMLIIAGLGGLGLVNACKNRETAKKLADQVDDIAKSAATDTLKLERIWDSVQASGVTLAASDKLDLVAAVEATMSKQLDRLPMSVLQRLQEMGEAIQRDDARIIAIIEAEAKTLGTQVAGVEQRLAKLLEGIKTNTDLLPDAIERIKRIEADVQKLTSGPRPTTSTPTNLPDPSPRFTARAKALLDLHDTLRSTGSAGLGQAAAVWADGGVGKTMLAEHYGWLHIKDYPAGVFKINADSASLIPQLAALAPFLGIPSTVPGNPPTPRPESDVAIDVRAALQRGDSLLILDNVPEGERWTDAAYTACLPSWPCRRLITTRANYLDNVQMQSLDTFTPSEGAAILARHRPDAGEEKNLPFARGISAWFGGLGAGLLVVGVYMALNKQLSWEAYAKDLGAKGLSAARATHEEVVSKITYKERFDRAFERAMSQLTPLERVALDYAALLPEDMVPLPWLRTLLLQDAALPPSAPKPGYATHADWAIAHLRTLGLLRETQTHSELVAMHRVLRETTRERVLANERSVVPLLFAIAACAAKRRAVIVGTTVAGEYRDVNDHAAVTDHKLRWEVTPLAALCAHLWTTNVVSGAASIGSWLGLVLQDLGRFAEAADCLSPICTHEQAVRDVLGAEEVALCYANLAWIRRQQGELEVAHERVLRAIDIIDQVPGQNHMLASKFRAFLAVIQFDRNQLTEAMDSISEAISIRIKSFECNHRSFASLYSKRAMLLLAQRKLKEARSSIELAIKIERSHFEPNHPTFAARYSNLAMIQLAQGELTDAEVTIRVAMQIDEQHFAADHVYHGMNLYRLGLIHAAKRNSSEACRSFSTALKILTKKLGAHHYRIQMIDKAKRDLGC